MATYRTLFNYCQQFDSWRLNGRPEYFLHKREINLFFQNNEVQIKILNHAIGEQNKKFFQCDENGHPLQDDKGQSIFKDELLKEEYQKEVTELFTRRIDVQFAGNKL